MSPLQIEALRLAHDLGEWSERLNEPVYRGSSTSADEFISFLLGEHGKWLDKSNASFLLNWKGKIATLKLRFEEAGVTDPMIDQLLDRRDTLIERVTEIRTRIVCMVYALDGLDSEPKEARR